MTGPDRGYALARQTHSGKTTEIMVTADGGLKWKAVKTIPYSADDIAAPDRNHAFLATQCQGSCKGSVVMGTTDGGRAWRTLYRSPDSIWALSFTGAKDGWALSGQRTTGTEPAHDVILHTTDGGKTWTRLAAPCQKQFPSALSFISAKEGWLVCSGQPAAGTQAKTLYRTDSGGRAWSLISTTGPLGASRPSGSGLPLAGYTSDLRFLNASDGWLGLNRAGYYATADGGKTWHNAWRSTFQPGADNAPSVGMLPSGFGWLLETNMTGKGQTLTALYTTANDGTTWREVYPLPG